MKMKHKLLVQWAAAFCAAFTLLSESSFAQQINGTPGSPDATMTISGKQLPPPDLKFGGVIKDTAPDSKPWWPPTVVPPKGAPNVLLIMTDDQGYGVSGTFGGVIPTPTMDLVAKAGKTVALLVHRDDAQLFIPVTIG
jgi:arylsulfatase